MSYSRKVRRKKVPIPWQQRERSDHCPRVVVSSILTLTPWWNIVNVGQRNEMSPHMITKV